MPTKNNIRVICFDFDGTIASTMPFLTDLAVDVLTKHCRLRPEDARNKYIHTTGLPFAEQVTCICGSRGTAIQAAVAEFEDRKKADYFRFVPETGARQTINSLKKKGYTVAISSSTQEQLIQNYLVRFDLSPDLVMGLRPDFRKGHDHFGHIQQKYQIESSSICYVADSINDYRIATALGVNFIAKRGLFDHAAFQALDADVVVIADLKELLAIF